MLESRIKKKVTIHNLNILEVFIRFLMINSILCVVLMRLVCLFTAPTIITVVIFITKY